MGFNLGFKGLKSELQHTGPWSAAAWPLPPMLSPRSIFHTFVSLHFQACKEKFDAHFKIDIIFFCLFFFKQHKLEIAYAQESLYKEMSIYDLNANWAVLGIKMAENGVHLTTSIWSIPCAVPTQFVTEFMGHLDKSILPCKVGFIMDLYC
jgi:hypothetical protein